MDGPFLADTFTPCEDARQIADFLIRKDQEHRFVFAADARIAYLLQQPQLTLKGEPADAYIATAKVQGSHRLLFQFLTAQYQPQHYAFDFVVYFDAAAWDTRKRNLEPGASGYSIEREALVYHELCHLKHLHTADDEPRFSEDGRPMLALTRHTYEFFQDEIRRYGPTTLALEQVGADFVAGSKQESARRTRGRLKLA